VVLCCLLRSTIAFTSDDHAAGMFKRLLVPLDGTPQAAAALPLARTIAHSAGGSLTLLRVADKADRSMETEHYLRSVADELQDRSVECLVRHANDAAVEIDTVAHDLAMDLIVMATHGRAGPARIFAGSVAERVLTHGTTPVVLVRPGGKRVTSLKTLLVPTDGTAGAAIALSSAIGLARVCGACMVLVQVTDPVPLWAYSADYGLGAGYIDPAWEDERLAAAETYVQGLSARLQAQGINAEGRALKGEVVATLEGVADTVDADLVIMRTHAHTGVARTVLGSTADALVRTAKRPVLLIRRPAGAADHEAARIGAAAASSSVSRSSTTGQ
jgi:nucleotide-binding universal stress UspA family protein